MEEREDGGKAETNGYSSVKDATQPPSSPAENTGQIEYSGTPLMRTPTGRKKVSFIERCPYFRG